MTIEQRLNRLERQNRRLKFGGMEVIMRSFRLAIGLFIFAGVVGCAEADPWVGEWKFVVDIEADVAELVEREEELAEMRESTQKRLEESAWLTEEERIEFEEEWWEPLGIDEPINIEKKAEELAAKLRAVPEDEGQFLTFERGKDGGLIAIAEKRGPENSIRTLADDVTESSELIRCKFLDAASGITLTYELKLVAKDLLEGSRSWGTLTKRPVKLERVR